MAGNIFLKLDSVTGASLVFPDTIELSTFSWGASNELNVHSGSTTTTSSTHIFNVSCTKPVDSASAAIIAACCGGTEIPTGKLTVGAPGAGSTPATTLELGLTEVYITSYRMGASGNATDLSESFSVHFGIVKGQYQQMKDGKAGAPSMFSWNPKKNQKS